MDGDSIHQEIFARVFGHRKRGLSIRMVPMIDMIFLLLIFFLVAGEVLRDSLLADAVPDKSR